MIRSPLSLISLTLALLVIILVAGWGLVIYLTLTWRSDIDQAAFNIMATNQRQQAVSRFASQAPNIATARQLVQSYVVTDATLVGFLETLDRLAARAKIAIKVANPTTANNVPPRLTFEVKVTGSFAGIWRFVKLVETMPFYVEISQLHLDHLATDKKTPTWSGSLSLGLLSYESTKP